MISNSNTHGKTKSKCYANSVSKLIRINIITMLLAILILLVLVVVILLLTVIQY